MPADQTKTPAVVECPRISQTIFVFLQAHSAGKSTGAQAENIEGRPATSTRSSPGARPRPPAAQQRGARQRALRRA
eukprot:365702-Chlamydomonas_euryale.AAC.17